MARSRIPDADGLAAVRASVRVVDGDADSEQPSPDRPTERRAVQYTLQVLTERAPGHSVEVRIPPFAAVQAIPGPVHRRGTPSAVVEMNPVTWLGLATGDLTWAEARAGGQIRASGERADLSPWLPLVRP